jgi:hypothetical protein
VFQLDGTSKQHFVGESTCTLFADRLLQCLDPCTTLASTPSDYRYVKNAAFARQSSGAESLKLPDRIRATLLVRLALKFIGQDYHFFLQSDFLTHLDAAYSTRESALDVLWTCKFFAVLALGELYCTTGPFVARSRDQSVPGENFFITAVNLLQDLFEEPCIAQIEIMLLFVRLIYYPNAT